MLRRIVYFLLPIFAIAVSVFIMNAGSYFKKPWNATENVPRYLNEIESDVKAEKWQDAEKNLLKLQNAWKRIVPRIQFSVERNEINSLSVNIARLTGSLEAKDKGNSLVEISEARQHWSGLEE